jgi:hypothetical protein
MVSRPPTLINPDQFRHTTRSYSRQSRFANELSNLFVAYSLARNASCEADLVDQLFNSSSQCPISRSPLFNLHK